MWRRIANLVRKDLIQLRRDRVLAPFVIFGPVMELVMVAYSTSAGIANLPTAVVDLDHTAASRTLSTAVANTPTFDVRSFPAGIAGVAPLLDGGTAAVAVVIPKGFAARLSDEASPAPQVQVIVDGSEPTAAQAAIASAQGVVALYSRRVGVAAAGLTEGVLTPIEAQVQVRFNEELKDANYTIPSEMGFMLSAITIMVASLGIARERELGTLEQLTVTPLRPVELIIGKAIPAIILSYVVFLLMLAISLGGFGVPMRGSWPLLLMLAGFYLFVELGWGIMASAISPTQLQALLLVFVFTMVETVFSGYAFPVENMPAGLQLVANLFPIKHWLIVFRSILLKGAGPAVYWRELVALAVLGTGVMGATVLVLRRKGLN